MTELFGSILVISAGIIIGQIKSDKLKKRCETSLLAEKMLRDIYIMLESLFLTRDEIFERLEKNKNYACFYDLFHGKTKADFPAENDIKELREFFSSLGTNDINGELMKTRLCLERLSESTKEAQEKYRKCNKLYKALGGLTGAAVVIMLI